MRRRPPEAKAVSDLLAALRRGLARGLGSRSSVTAEDIEDFAQNAVIRVLERLDGFRGDSRFTTWVTSIAIRLALTQMRKRAWGERSLEDLAEQLGCQLNAVYKLYHDARKKLRRALEDRGVSAVQVSSMLTGSSED